MFDRIKKATEQNPYWGGLSGYEWARTLSKHPEYASSCNFIKLNGWHWTILLRAQPQFANKCMWWKLDGRQWCILLRERPEFAEHCIWDMLEGHDWAILLLDQPQFAKHCDWDQLDSCDLTRVFSYHPELISADRYLFRLNDADWRVLFMAQPQLMEFRKRKPLEIPTLEQIKRDMAERKRLGFNQSQYLANSGRAQGTKAQSPEPEAATPAT